jgi:hypothetical protein
MSKRFNKNNLTRIIHDIKEDYSKAFHQKVPQSPEMETIIVNAAKLVKEGKKVRWELNKTKRVLVVEGKVN